MNGRAPDRDEVLRTLRAHEAELRAQGVTALYLFGSVARGDATAESDIDLFYDYDRDRFGLRPYMRLRDLGPEILGRAVDMIPRNGLHRLVREEAFAEAVPVF